MAESQISIQISEQIIPKIIVPDEGLKYKIDFKDKIQTARNEIQTKFMEFFNQLQNEMVCLLEKVDAIENEVLAKFELSSNTLFEMLKARENAVVILKSNSTSHFLEKKLRIV